MVTTAWVWLLLDELDDKGVGDQDGQQYDEYPQRPQGFAGAGAHRDRGDRAGFCCGQLARFKNRGRILAVILKALHRGPCRLPKFRGFGIRWVRPG